MKDVKDFDLKQFVPESSATVTTVAGGDVRPSKRSVSSEHNELTERNEAAGQPEPTPLSERTEEIMSTRTSEQTAKPRPTASTSANEQSVSGYQTAPAQSTEPIQQIEPSQLTQPTPAPPSRVSSRQRRASLDEYRDTFLTIPKIADRQPVFVSRDIRDKIDCVVRRLGERKMSVSGFLENLARHHLELYAEDLEQWKRL